MRKFTALFSGLVILVIVLGLALAVHPAAAQEETPTPTPETSKIIEMDGDHFKLDYTITLGDMAIVIVGLFLATILTTYATTRIITTFIR